MNVELEETMATSCKRALKLHLGPSEARQLIKMKMANESDEFSSKSTVPSFTQAKDLLRAVTLNSKCRNKQMSLLGDCFQTTDQGSAFTNRNNFSHIVELTAYQKQGMLP